MEVEDGLGFYDCYLVGVGVECVDVQFVQSGLEINIAERFKSAGGQL